MKAAILYKDHSFYKNKNGQYGKGCMERLSLEDFPKANPAKYDFVIVDPELNQEIADKNRKLFREYLSQGGHLLFCGSVKGQWLEHVRWREKKPREDFSLYKADEEHEVWNHIDVSEADSALFQGVFLAGEDKEKILVNHRGESLIYTDRNTYPGNLYLIALASHGSYLQRTEKLFDGFVEWVQSDIKRLKGLSISRPMKVIE